MVERIKLKKANVLEELVLDMVSTPDFILKSVDWGSVKGTHHSYRYVNQVGESIANTSLGTRDIKIDGWIVAKDEEDMTNLKRKLNFFINPQEAIELHYSVYTIGFVPDESVKYSITYQENNDVFCKFQIVGTAPNPLFFDNVESGSVFAATRPIFHFPLFISEETYEKGLVFGKRTESLITNFLNKGSVSIGMRIVFKANGTVTNPKIININTQEEFKINKMLVDGEEIEINTNVGEKRVRGKIGNASFTNYFMYKDIDSPWLQLSVGNNLFAYNADEGVDSLDVFIYFYNRYLEVQECY